MIEFGTGGSRGVIGDDFTRENAERIAQALAAHIHAEGSKNPSRSATTGGSCPNSLRLGSRKCSRGERELFFVNGAEQKCATIALDALGETLDVEYVFPPRGKREKTILSEEI